MIDNLSEQLLSATPERQSDAIFSVCQLFERHFIRNAYKFGNIVLSGDQYTGLDISEAEIHLLTRTLERILVSSESGAGLLGTVVWALGKCYTCQSQTLLLKFLRERHRDIDANVAYQLVIALESLQLCDERLSETCEQLYTDRQLFEYLRELPVRTDNRIKQVIERLMHGYG
jgi:hypothetical protein